LARQTIPQIARSEKIAFTAGKWAGVDAENHGQSRFVDGQRLERLRIFLVGDAFTDLNAFDTRDSDDVAGDNGFGFIAFQTAKRIEVRDFRLGQFAVDLSDGHFGSAMQCRVEHTRDGDAPEKFRIVQVGHLKLQHTGWIASWGGNFIYDRFEKRKKIFGTVTGFGVSNAQTGVGVDHGKVELVFGGVQVDEQVVNFVQHFFGASVGAIDFVENHDRRKFGSQ